MNQSSPNTTNRRCPRDSQGHPGHPDPHRCFALAPFLKSLRSTLGCLRVCSRLGITIDIYHSSIDYRWRSQNSHQSFEATVNYPSSYFDWAEVSIFKTKVFDPKIYRTNPKLLLGKFRKLPGCFVVRIPQLVENPQLVLHCGLPPTLLPPPSAWQPLLPGDQVQML